MALDGVTIAHLINELNPLLSGARIDKIQQPEKEEIHLLLRQQGHSYRLLLNAGATMPRFHLTTISKKNPPSPPMFCMILRKHLEGGKFLGFSQQNLERTVTMAVQSYNEYGDLTVLHLHLEIMGKHSNLLLVDPASNLILDGLKRYSHSVSRHREVLPGRIYIAPPSQGKVEVSREEQWRETLMAAELDKTIPKIIVEHFAGISPELAQEITVRSGLDIDCRLAQCGEIDINRLFQNYALLARPASQPKTEPCLYFNPPGKNSLNQNLNVPLAFSFVPFQQFFGLYIKKTSDLNTAIAEFYELKNASNNLEARRGSLQRLVRELQAHLAKKIAVFEETISSARQSLIYQKWGELLLANLYRLSPGIKEISVEDFYDDTLPLLTIPLNPLLSGIENAQRYFRLYNKAKATIQKTTPLHKNALEELQYLDSLNFSLQNVSNPIELDEIHQELAAQGYIAVKQPKKPAKPKRSPQAEPSKPRIFLSSQGRQILVGKNNLQNEWLALKQGKPHDLWLHVKNIPGSHVLVPLKEGEEFPDDRTLEEAAALAVFFSQARDSSLVPVDYTHVKQLKKPKGSKPGMIVYEQNWTLYITPEKETMHALLQTEQE